MKRFAALFAAGSKAEVPITGMVKGHVISAQVDRLAVTEAEVLIVDYKTNRIQAGDLSAEVFSTEAMAAEMMASHYPLQALLYSVALHRYLRWRLPGYSPERHLGPVQYHFVRGMIGPDTPSGCGVFQWDVPAGLVVDLSDLLAGGAP